MSECFLKLRKRVKVFTHRQFKAVLYIMTVICCFLFVSASCLAKNDTYKVGRYLVEEAGPTDWQKNVFQSKFSGKVPEGVLSIGDGVKYILIGSGYELLPAQNNSREIILLMGKQLGIAHREFKESTLQEILLAMVGNEYQLLIDTANRHVSFQLKRELTKLY